MMAQIFPFHFHLGNRTLQNIPWGGEWSIFLWIFEKHETAVLQGIKEKTGRGCGRALRGVSLFLNRSRLNQGSLLPK